MLDAILKFFKEDFDIEIYADAWYADKALHVEANYILKDNLNRYNKVLAHCE